MRAEHMVMVLASLIALGAVGMTDWATVIQPATKAVLRLEMQAEGEAEPGTCSAVIINVESGFAITAAHCVDSKNVALTIDGRHAEVVRTNRVLDLAVVRFATKKSYVALPLAKDAPTMGQEIAVIGYAFGSRQLGTQVGHVSTALDEEKQVMRVGVDVIAGDSGGACINAAGELVGITVAVQHWGPMHLGIVVPLQTVSDFVQPYVQKEVK